MSSGVNGLFESRFWIRSSFHYDEVIGVAEDYDVVGDPAHFTQYRRHEQAALASRSSPPCPVVIHAPAFLLCDRGQGTFARQAWKSYQTGIG
jgi:hypothetical protein